LDVFIIFFLTVITSIASCNYEQQMIAATTVQTIASRTRDFRRVWQVFLRSDKQLSHLRSGRWITTSLMRLLFSRQETKASANCLDATAES